MGRGRSAVRSHVAISGLFAVRTSSVSLLATANWRVAPATITAVSSFIFLTTSAISGPSILISTVSGCDRTGIFGTVRIICSLCAALVFLTVWCRRCPPLQGSRTSQIASLGGTGLAITVVSRRVGVCHAVVVAASPASIAISLSAPRRRTAISVANSGIEGAASAKKGAIFQSTTIRKCELSRLDHLLITTVMYFIFAKIYIR